MTLLIKKDTSPRDLLKGKCKWIWRDTTNSSDWISSWMIIFLLTQLFTSWRKTVKVPEYRHFSSCQPRNESLLKEEDVVDLCRRCNYFWKGTSKQNSGRFTKFEKRSLWSPFAEVYWQLLFMQRWIWTRENYMSDMFSVPENWRTVSTILIINHIFEYSKVIRTIDNIASIRIPKSF